MVNSKVEQPVLPAASAKPPEFRLECRTSIQIMSVTECLQITALTLQ